LKGASRSLQNCGTQAPFAPTAIHKPRPVSFAHDGLVLDVGVGKHSQQALHVGANNKVLVSLPYADWSEIKGLSMGVNANLLRSSAVAIGAEGQVAGNSTVGSRFRSHAFIWTRASGLVDIRTLGGSFSTAFGVNNKGQVVGAALTKGGQRLNAFVSTAKQGMVDLNKRLRHRPAGLVLDRAYAISDNGTIVASSNAGIVLLEPDAGPKGVHTVGPITGADLVPVNRRMTADDRGVGIGSAQFDII
jgi:probable HAF family extracellular repeat protein